jgi:hypothetical protein
MSLVYHPDIAADAVMELSNALRAFRDMEYANALLSDPRMTNTKGLLASCGFSYKEIKRIREQVSGHIPTLDAQRKAINFLNQIDKMQESMKYVAA